MSQFVSSRCACGVDIVSVSPDQEDIMIALGAHQMTARHEEWRAVQALKLAHKPKGKCICKGGEAAPKFRVVA